MSCLDGTQRLHLLLEEFGIIVEDLIDQSQNQKDEKISDAAVDDAINQIYQSIDTVTKALALDWLTSSSVTTTLLLSKLTGFGLITWGRNLGDWPKDVPLTDVQTGYKIGIMGRALLYSLFVLDDFR